MMPTMTAGRPTFSLLAVLLIAEALAYAFMLRLVRLIVMIIMLLTIDYGLGILMPIMMAIDQPGIRPIIVSVVALVSRQVQVGLRIPAERIVWILTAWFAPTRPLGLTAQLAVRL
jgi:hypothetical protein